MASEEVQLAWKLSIAGAEEVKRSLAEVHDQFDRGEVTAAQYGKELGKQNSTLRALTSSSAMQNRMWLASHPTLNQLSRTMSGLNRVFMATTQAMTAINTAQMLMRMNNGQVIELQNQLAEATRNYNAALTPEDQEKWAREQARIADELERTKQNMSSDFINGIVSFGSAIGGVVTSVVLTATKLGGLSGPLSGAAAWFGRAATSALSFGGGLFGMAGMAAGALGLLVGEWIKAEVGIEGSLTGTKEDWDRFFFETIPNAITSGIDWFIKFATGNAIVWAGIVQFFGNTWNSINDAFSQFWEGLKSLATLGADSVVKTVSGMADKIISYVKKALDWLAKLPGNIASGIGNLISGGSKSSSSGSNVKKGAAGLHDVTSGPQLYLAGEGGVREEVSIKSIGRSGASTAAGGTTITVHNHIAGSLLAQRDLEGMIDQYGVREARLRGWKAR